MQSKNESDQFKMVEAAEEKKALSLLGLATKAGFVQSGEFMTEKCVKEGRAKLVVVAADASENTKKMFRDMCAYYKTPIIFFCEKTILGHSIGKEFRASLVVTDSGFALSIAKLLSA